VCRGVLPDSPERRPQIAYDAVPAGYLRVRRCRLAPARRSRIRPHRIAKATRARQAITASRKRNQDSSEIRFSAVGRPDGAAVHQGVTGSPQGHQSRRLTFRQALHADTGLSRNWRGRTGAGSTAGQIPPLRSCPAVVEPSARADCRMGGGAGRWRGVALHCAGGRPVTSVSRKQPLQPPRRSAGIHTESSSPADLH